MRPNPLDERADQYQQALETGAARLEDFSQGVEPFDSEKLDPNEALLLYDNPMAFFLPEPMTNEEAAVRLLQEKGAVWYVKWVEDMEALKAKTMGAQGEGDVGLLPPA